MCFSIAGLCNGKQLCQVNGRDDGIQSLNIYLPGRFSYAHRGSSGPSRSSAILHWEATAAAFASTAFALTAADDVAS